MEEVDQIKEILMKFSEAEETLDKKLLEIKQEELKSKSNNQECDVYSREQRKLISLEEAKLRNSNLIKTLEISKARIRSRSTFSPIEQILQKAVENYKKTPALQQYSNK